MCKIWNTIKNICQWAYKVFPLVSNTDSQKEKATMIIESSQIQLRGIMEENGEKSPISRPAAAYSETQPGPTVLFIIKPG